MTIRAITAGAITIGHDYMGHYMPDRVAQRLHLVRDGHELADRCRGLAMRLLLVQVKDTVPCLRHRDLRPSI